jgi:hypothetical protein
MFPSFVQHVPAFSPHFAFIFPPFCCTLLAHRSAWPRPLHWAALMRAQRTFGWSERPLVTLHGHALAEKAYGEMDGDVHSHMSYGQYSWLITVNRG